MTNYTASKSRSQGRKGWTALFHHPVVVDLQDRPRRIRRGLGTRDEAEADLLIEELNEILATPELWSPAARSRAEQRFDARVVSAFYGPMEPRVLDSWAAREEVLPLPTPEDGYSRVLVLGATGAGKTTLVRQLIGTDPVKERFPSTSTAKTTIADLEVILAPGTFEAVVSFIGRDLARLYVEECVTRAILEAADGAGDEKVLTELLEHREQRFRLFYVLGKGDVAETAEDDWGDDVEDITDDVEVTKEERAQHLAVLEALLRDIRQLGEALRQAVEGDLGSDFERLCGGDRDAFLDLLEERASKDAGAAAIVDTIMDELIARFGLAEGGELEWTTDGWPHRWTTSSSDRKAFIRYINRFASNYAPNFGKLLTPLVDGIRVRGPFKPSWMSDSENRRLVLMDGEGLGHTTQSSASLPTAVTTSFSRADVILIVDNAQQPMLAAPQAALRTITARGHDSKLALAFTHFDLVKGDNLRTPQARRDHVLRSLENILAGLEGALGTAPVRGLRRDFAKRVFFLAEINKRLEKLKPGMRRFTETELGKLLDHCEKSIQPAEGEPAVPVYDLGNFVLCIAKATSNFQGSWDGRLGIRMRPGVSQEHWTRIKALSRRFAEFGADAYDTLSPVADLNKEVTEAIADFVSSPRGWKPPNASEKSKEVAVELVRRRMAELVSDFAAKRLKQEPLPGWIHAWNLRGAGSGTQRGREIWSIYQIAAPNVSEVPTSDSAEVLDQMRSLFREAIKVVNGEIAGEANSTT